MEELVLNYRNIMLLIILISSISLLPEAAPALAKPFFILWTRLKRYHESLLSRSPKENGSKYWEIDMTKFEP